MILIICKWMGTAVLTLGTVLVLAACAPGPADGAPRVVATTGILGDVVGNLVEGVETVMPLGADPHEFQSSPRQAQLIAEADVIVASGLGLELGLSRLLEAARAEGTAVIEAGCLAEPLTWEGDPGECGTDEALDPHFWMDPVRMADVVIQMGDLLTEAGWAEARENARRYRDEILAAHQAIESSLAPVADRPVATNHDFLRYFARRYGLIVVGVVIPGGSTETEPSASYLADLVRTLETRDVRVLLTETTEPDAVARAVAAEVSHPVAIVELYAGSLGARGSGADTYLGMLRTDATRIVEALSAG